MSKLFGKTWWGEQWLNSLAHIDYDNRLPRGSTYAKKGAVKKIEIEQNTIRAKVQGSRVKLYEVTIIVPPFFPQHTDKFIKAVAAKPAVISKLLNRELDPEVLQIAEQHGLQIFPIKQRQEMVDRFQHNRADRIFILSLKAAGTGLNLTAAAHVIHYDLWWNPAVEAQATDRAYRIGQKSNVMVHRFITKGTFEERINEMIQSKKALADMTVATGENWIGNLNNHELKELFELK